MSVQYASIIQRTAWLNTEFGLELACKKLGKTPEEIEALVGRNKKGKRKGQLKGQLIWYSVVTPGWVRMGFYNHEALQANGFVQRMKVSYGYAIHDPYKSKPDGTILPVAWDVDFDEDRNVSLDRYRMHENKHISAETSSTG